MDVLQADSLADIHWLVHGFSTRVGGFSKVYGQSQLNLGFTRQDSRVAVEKNRRAFASVVTEKTGRAAPRSGEETGWQLAVLRQIHSDVIHCITKVPHVRPAGDGFVTNTPGTLLPVILVDVERWAVGGFHAGWRGTVKRIVQKGVGEMQRWFGTRPKDLRAAIGPGIRGCCYEVGPEVREAFESQFLYADALFRETKETNEIHERYPLLFLTARAPGHSELPTKIFLDLAEANRRQLIEAGVPAKNINNLGQCSSCYGELFFSHRREKGVTGRMMA